MEHSCDLLLRTAWRVKQVSNFILNTNQLSKKKNKKKKRDQQKVGVQVIQVHLRSPSECLRRINLDVPGQK